MLDSIDLGYLRKKSSACKFRLGPVRFTVKAAGPGTQSTCTNVSLQNEFLITSGQISYNSRIFRNLYLGIRFVLRSQGLATKWNPCHSPSDFVQFAKIPKICPWLQTPRLIIISQQKKWVQLSSIPPLQQWKTRGVPCSHHRSTASAFPRFQSFVFRFFVPARNELLEIRCVSRSWCRWTGPRSLIRTISYTGPSRDISTHTFADTILTLAYFTPAPFLPPSCPRACADTRASCSTPKPFESAATLVLGSTKQRVGHFST